ncbi:MAG TPA: DUF1330 domain-containing protein [Stellaceae bacterium]|nr:DUF1330 domain-containing protein [Stellaceae bacterium]
MSAYVVVQEDIKDEAMFDQYRKQVMPTIAAHGGKFIVRGGKISVIEGEWPMPRFVIIEFASRQAAEGWYNSPEYRKILPLRLKSGKGNLIIVDGA